MSEFQFDTSGSVRGSNNGQLQRAVGKLFEDSQVRWRDLSPFVQDCIMALAEGDIMGRYAPLNIRIKFRSLSRDALARIILDASDFLAQTTIPESGLDGRTFWNNRQCDMYPGFPAVVVSFARDGLVHLTKKNP